MSCLIVGLGLLLGLSTVWGVYAQSDLGKFVDSVSQSLVSAGILGFVYELLARETSRRDEEDLLVGLTERYRLELREETDRILLEISKTPLQLNESVKLFGQDRQIEIVRQILSNNVGSDDVADAVLKSLFSLANDRDEVWRDTAHKIEFTEEPELRPYNLVRLVDRISYTTTIRHSVFRVGLLRSRDIQNRFSTLRGLDAFWLVERGFVSHEGGVKRLVGFDALVIRVDGVDHEPASTETVLEDGSAIIEYILDDRIVGMEAMISYRFNVVVDSMGPYLHVALPCPSVGLRILVRNHIPRFTRVVDRLFVPDGGSVARSSVGSDVHEIQTSQVVLRGHGAIILLR